MPGALDVIGRDVGAELSARSEVAVDLAIPPGEAAGIGERFLQVVDRGGVAVFDANDARGLRRPQAAEDAGAWA
jgi:hypothetical protein